MWTRFQRCLQMIQIRLSGFAALMLACLFIFPKPKVDAQESGRAAEEQAGRPNLLFIAVDDLRPQLGCYGETWMKSPNIDRLAESGVVFSRHYVQVATCGASRYAMLTGLRPRVNADYGNTPFQAHREDLASREVESFPHLFQQEGYHTVAVGKISHAWRNSAVNLPRSWSEILPLERGSGHTLPSYKERPPFEAGAVDDMGYSDGQIAERAVEALGRLKDQPFLLAVGFFRPHLPFNSPQKYWDLYDPDNIPAIPHPETPGGVDKEISLHPSMELLRQYKVPEGALEDPAYIKQLRHAYCAAVSYVDAQVGKVLDEVDRLGLSDNTIVVLWGDHGWHLGDLGVWGKHTAYERALRSPLIVRHPHLENAGQVNDALIETVDIYPTLAAFCGLTEPEGLGGDSFAELLRDPEASPPTAAFGYHRPWGWGSERRNELWGKTMRMERYRFTAWTREATGGEVVQVELYDHQVDPEESNNIARTHPELVGQLLERLGEDGLPWNVKTIEP